MIKITCIKQLPKVLKEIKKINIWDHTQWKVTKPLEALNVLFGACLPYINFTTSEELTKNNVILKEEYKTVQVNEFLIILFNGKLYEIPNCLRFDYLSMYIPNGEGFKIPITLSYKLIYGDLEKYKIHGRIYTFFLVLWLKNNTNKLIKKQKKGVKIEPLKQGINHI